MKISILYHSGIDNMKLIARLIQFILKQKKIDWYIISIENNINLKMLYHSDEVIFDIPIYHAEPSISIQSFMNIRNNIFDIIKNRPCFSLPYLWIVSSNCFKPVCSTVKGKRYDIDIFCLS